MRATTCKHSYCTNQTSHPSGLCNGHIPYATVYDVREQWPHRLIKTFDTLAEAQEYVRVNARDIALPLITSRVK